MGSRNQVQAQLNAAQLAEPSKGLVDDPVDHPGASHRDKEAR